ncbi:hypothetical protein WICPIJ_006403 [Wickerhamomyces pijperi]|uniref:Uncharacterized protein n=1 Tax=Wickerhamomyces pijperi TaxID=599730 RepID=A0A9P8Q253_WICPI|nr:hypothetical protein WICPIJ_006403 [Wickerhamomyces pijperi]
MVDSTVLRERVFTVLKEEEVAKPAPSESWRRMHFRAITGSISDQSIDYGQRPERFIYIKVSHHNFKPSLLEALQNQMRSAQATNIENSSEAKYQRDNTTISSGTRPKQSRFFPRSSKDPEENRTGELTNEVDENGFKSANFGDDEEMEKEDHSTSSITTWFD